MVIWKFKIKNMTEKIKMPLGSTLLSCQMQDNEITIWALCDPTVPTDYQTFHVEPTGAPVSQEILLSSFVATVQSESGLVWHVFRERDERFL